MVPDRARDFVAAWQDSAQALSATYHSSQEHDACGVGLVAALDGRHRRDVVQAGIDALKAVWHRGAVDADGKTGDGAETLWSSRRALAWKETSRRGEDALGPFLLHQPHVGRRLPGYGGRLENPGAVLEQGHHGQSLVK